MRVTRRSAVVVHRSVIRTGVFYVERFVTQRRVERTMERLTAPMTAALGRLSASLVQMLRSLSPASNRSNRHARYRHRARA